MKHRELKFRSFMKPYTTKIESINQNIGALFMMLKKEVRFELQSLTSENVVEGERYRSGISTWIE